MFITLRMLLRLLLVAAVAWAVLVYGLPAARAALPGGCARWKLQGGFCTEGVQSALARVDAWSQQYLKPLPRHRRVQQAVAQVAAALRQLEDLARGQVGDERVDAAVQGADIAIQKLEGVVGETGGAREKLADVPENAQVLLGRVRDAFERLRSVLSSTSRRAEEVSGAVEETKHALDALSKALPSGEERTTPAPSPRP